MVRLVHDERADKFIDSVSDPTISILVELHVMSTILVDVCPSRSAVALGSCVAA